MSLWTTLQHALPHHAISRTVGAFSRLTFPPLVRPLLRIFVRAFGIDLSDAERTRLDDYRSFNDLFTRSLAAGARPIAPDDRAIASPVDGTVSAFGRLDNDRLVQAKGRDYTAAALLGDPALAQTFEGGTFLTVYLAPYNYHRIHFPTAGTVRHMRLVPGRLFSVNTATAAAVDRLFARNERVVTTIAADRSHYALVAVGALNVGSIETVWHGAVTPPRAKSVREWTYDPPTRFARGDEWGRFNFGSTVILLWPPGVMALNDGLAEGDILRLGERIGRWQHAAP